MFGATRHRSRLIAGQRDLEKFCLEIFSIPDPVIIIWRTEEKPTMPNEVDTAAAKIEVVDDVNLFFKENLDSLFFPNGFILNDWNLVLASIKEGDVFRKYSNTDGIVKGWMMGTDINSQTFIGGKILIKMP